MTPDEYRELQRLIDIAGSTAMSCVEGTATTVEVEQADQAIHAYADRLLKAKDAEIAHQMGAQIDPDNLMTQTLTSSIDLVQRFGGTLTERGSFAKFNEEVDELKRSIYTLTDSTQAHPQMLEHVAEELADVLITAAGMVSYANVPVPLILTVLRRKLATNRAKSIETHHWDEDRKMVVRKAVQE